MNLAPQQEAAVKKVSAWIGDRFSIDPFKLFGVAGTGKTTLARLMAESASGKVLYAAYTGKAALQLRRKGCPDASTIHSLIYKPEVDDATGEATFVLNPDSDLASASLLVVDEVSMVDEATAKDLLSFKKKILVLGDPAQLPPVTGEGFFINGTPDVMLTEVHRQARDNPIIRLSMDIREGRALAPGQYGESLVVHRQHADQDHLRDLVVNADQVLCGLNRTRVSYNRRVREIKGLGGGRDAWHPTSGDRLICLRNNKEKMLFNGGLWLVERVRNMGRYLEMVVTSEDYDRSPVCIRVPEQFFNGTEQSLDWRRRREKDEFTFGWAITCHKSQGSQWDDVVVFDESRAFRDDAAKWLYTAVTRAAEKVTVVI
ncbi:ATP-dependent RecD-like DNA helicase [Sphingobium sp. R-7]|uniref:ATP-dependent DNA helicase n=1 Tax=Sphingobium sp. R-7 TaxID=3375449 RepID=UPI00398A7EB2